MKNTKIYKNPIFNKFNKKQTNLKSHQSVLKDQSSLSNKNLFSPKCTRYYSMNKHLKLMKLGLCKNKILIEKQAKEDKVLKSIHVLNSILFAYFSLYK